MTEYFEDMWLGLEDELKSFDSFNPSDNFTSEPSSSTESFDNQEVANIEPKTYESLMESKNAPDPSHDQLRSTDLKERIQAIKEIYNKQTTILNWASVKQLHKTADSLYKKGLVRQANNLMAQVDQAIDKAEEQDIKQQFATFIENLD